MAITITAASLRAAIRLGDTTDEVAEGARLLLSATAIIKSYVGQGFDNIPDDLANEAVVRICGYLLDAPAGPRAAAYRRPDSVVRSSGAGDLLARYVHRTAGVVGGAAARSAPSTPSTPATPAAPVAGEIADNSITTKKIRDSAVTLAKLAADVVSRLGAGAAAVADGAITAAKLAAGAVTAAKLASDAVETAKLKDGAVTAAKLASDAVETAKIKDGAVDNAKIKGGAVSYPKIQVGSVRADILANNAVETAKLKDGAVETAKLKDDAVTAAKLANNAVQTASINNSAVVAAKIGTGAVTNTKLGAAAVTEAKIANSQITAAKLANNAVETAKIKDGAITTRKLDDAVVNTAKLKDGAVTAAKIANASITTAKLASGAGGGVSHVTAASSISANTVPANPPSQSRFVAGPTTFDSQLADSDKFSLSLVKFDGGVESILMSVADIGFGSAVRLTNNANAGYQANPNNALPGAQVIVVGSYRIGIFSDSSLGTRFYVDFPANLVNPSGSGSGISYGLTVERISTHSAGVKDSAAAAAAAFPDLSKAVKTTARFSILDGFRTVASDLDAPTEAGWYLFNAGYEANIGTIVWNPTWNVQYWPVLPIFEASASPNPSGWSNTMLETVVIGLNSTGAMGLRISRNAAGKMVFLQPLGRNINNLHARYLKV